MADLMKIDLHMHSNCSDGTDSPRELLENVKAAGLELFALTDHDAVKGCSIIRSARQAGDPAFITGVEFSCEDELGKYHILGYGYDLNRALFRQVIEAGYRFRIKKMRARVDFLKEAFGFTFPEKELEELFSQETPGKPHLGNLMVKYGYAKTRKEAIDDFINKKDFPMEHLRPEEAIKGVLAGGGIPVLAHPFYGDGDQLILGDEMDERIRRLMEFGLQGVEAFYSGFTNKLTRDMIAFAERYDLYVTAGSDYHGRNKMIDLADTGLQEMDQWPEGLKRFITDIAGKPGYYI